MAILKKSQKYEICWLYAQRKSYREIVAYFREKYDIEVWHGQIQWYIHPNKAPQKWLDEIEKRRKEFDAAFMDEDLASKRVRLRGLKEAQDRAMEWNLEGETEVLVANPDYVEGALTSATVNPKYIRTKVAKYKSYPGVAVAAIKQAQEEVDGKKFQMEHSTKDGEPLKHEITHFPPEPKDLADWEKQVAEATEKREEQEAKSEKEIEDKPPLLTH